MEQERFAVLRGVVRCAAVCGVLLCACDARIATPARAPHALIGAEAGPNAEPSVLIWHIDSGMSCSGGLIGRRLVVTALHCLYDSRGDAMLRVDGLQVSFGAVRDQGPVVAVDEVEVAGSVVTGLSAAVADGRDVVLLWLAADGPPGVDPFAVELDYAPRVRDAFYVSGFGLSSAAGENGKRLRAAAVLSGYDAETGVLQLHGAVPCYGDSGGPAVLQRRNALVGVLGQLAVEDDAGTCGAALAFVYSVRNAAVRALLEAGCARAGGCGPGADADAGDGSARVRKDAGAVAGDDAGPADGGMDAGLAHDAGASEPEPPSEANRGCTCDVPGQKQEGRSAGLHWLAPLAVMAARRRRARARDQGGTCAPAVATSAPPNPERR